ncbi:MAG: hypothetical protein U0T33_01610 [Bacteroidales bacterium]
MKTLPWIAWISLGTGCLLILFAAISAFTGTHLFGTSHIISFFHAANSFFLAAIALFIFIYRCKCNKE